VLSFFLSILFLLRRAPPIGQRAFLFFHGCFSPPPPPSVRMEQLGSHVTDFHEILYLNIFRKSVEKIQASLKSDQNNVTLREDQYTFFIISHSVLLRMRNVSDKSCRENQNTHFVFNKCFFLIVPFMR
jgi:hypothetical protein